MEFNLISFTLSPSTEVFNRCRKEDLLLIADMSIFQKSLQRKSLKRTCLENL